MRTINFSGGEALQAKLQEIMKKVGNMPEVKVGFLEGSTYPDGTPVAQVAATQNYGSPAMKIPARPFFTNMIKAKSPKWGANLERIAIANDYDMQKSMEKMGEAIGSQLVDSIVATRQPPLSPVTLMLRKMRRENQDLVVNAAVVAEARRRVADGESYSGESTKPLVDTKVMLNSVGYQVGDGAKILVDGS